MLNYAVWKEKVSRNAATFVSEDLPRAEKADSVALTEGELKQLLTCADEPDANGVAESPRRRKNRCKHARILRWRERVGRSPIVPATTL